MPQFPNQLSPAAPTYHPQPVSSPDTAHDHLPVGDETQIDAQIETILHGERADKAKQSSFTSPFATFREKMATLETDVASLPDGGLKADLQKVHGELKDSVQQLRTSILMLKRGDRSPHYSDLVAILHKHADLQDQFKALAGTVEQHANAQKPDVKKIVAKVLLGIAWAAGCVASAIFLGPMAPAGWAGVTTATAFTASLFGLGPMLSAFKDFRAPSGAHSRFQKDEFVDFRNEVFTSLSALVKKTLTPDNLKAAIQDSMQADVSHGPTPLTEFIDLVSNFDMSDSQREKLMDDVKNSLPLEEKRVLAEAISHSSLTRGAAQGMLGKLVNGDGKVTARSPQRAQTEALTRPERSSALGNEHAALANTDLGQHPLFEQMAETLLTYCNQKYEEYQDFLPSAERKRDLLLGADQIVPMAEFYLRRDDAGRQFIENVVERALKEEGYLRTLPSKVQHTCHLWRQALNAIRREEPVGGTGDEIAASASANGWSEPGLEEFEEIGNKAVDNVATTATTQGPSEKTASIKSSRTANWFSRRNSIGPKLTPSALTNMLSTRLYRARLEETENGSVLLARTTVGGISTVVSKPCHDLPQNASEMKKVQSGGSSLADAIRAVGISADEKRILIPVAQANPYWFGSTRGHFTLLDVSVRNGNVERATLYDPKGSTSFTYNGTQHITRQLREAGIGCSSMPVLKQLPHQGLFNFNDCGRYVGTYILGILRGSTPDSEEPDANTRFV